MRAWGKAILAMSVVLGLVAISGCGGPVPPPVGTQYTLTVLTEGQGSTNPAAGDHLYAENSYVTVTAVPSADWHFLRWSGDATGGASTIGLSMDQNHTVKATFEQNAAQYTINVTTQGQGSVSPGLGDQPFAAGAEVTFEATPAQGWHFVRWSGDVSGSEPIMRVLIDRSLEIVAVFEQDASAYGLLVRTQGQGTTDPAAGEHSYAAGTQVVLKATPAEGWHFVRWEGDVQSTQSTVQVLMDSRAVVTAVFEQDAEQYTLSIAVKGGGRTEPAAGVHTYDANAQVGLKALAFEGRHFVRWEGDITGTNPVVDLSMTSNKQVTAVFEQDAQQYPLIVNVMGQGTTVPAAGEHLYDAGMQVDLTATPSEVWHFVRWQGDVSSTDEAVSVLMNNGRSVTAVFEPDAERYVLTMNVSGQGTTDPARGQHEYSAGRQVGLTATPAEGWHFVRWSGDISGTTALIPITMNSSMTVTAVFEPNAEQYTLTVNVQGQGTTDPAVGQHAYASGAQVDLSATAASGWHFVRWQGDVSSTDQSIQVSMDRGKTVTAVFAQDAANYTLTMEVQGQGTTDPAAGQHVYAANTQMNLSATASAGWRFDHWEGALTSSANPAALTLDGNKTARAIFVEESVEQFQLTVNTQGQGTVSVQSGLYAAGTQLTLQATPAAGWLFDHWEGSVTGTSMTASLTMDGAKTVTAFFVEGEVGSVSYGDNDGFQAGNEEDVIPYQSTRLGQAIVNLPSEPNHPWPQVATFDSTLRDNVIGWTHQFTIPAGQRVVRARLRLGIIATWTQPETDVFWFDGSQFLNNGTPLYELVALRNYLDPVPGDRVTEIVLDLGNLKTSVGNPGYPDVTAGPVISILSELNDGELDVMFGDDVGVDYAKLEIETAPE